MSGYKESIKASIRDELLSKLKASGGREGDLLAPQWLYNEYLPSLSTKEEKVFEEVIGEMIKEGLVEYTGGPKPTYKLTNKGATVLG